MMISTLVLLVILVAVILILQKVGVPANIIQIAWIVMAAIVAIYAIRFLLTTA